jgi:hypothetical protein
LNLRRGLDDVAPCFFFGGGRLPCRSILWHGIPESLFEGFSRVLESLLSLLVQQFLCFSVQLDV